MSNALARKKKRMLPLGYSKSELIGIQKYAKAQNNADYLITESYYNVRMMAYQALHDMFGFGQKRIVGVEQTIEMYLGDAEKDGNKKESVRTIGYFGNMKQCIKALLERYLRELSEKAQISFNESLETLHYDDRITNRIKERTYQIAFPEESVRDHIAEQHREEMIQKVMGDKSDG